MYLVQSCPFPPQLQELSSFILPHQSTITLPAHKLWFFYSHHTFTHKVVAQEGGTAKCVAQEIDRQKTIDFFEKRITRTEEDEETYLLSLINKDYGDCTLRFQHSGQQEFIVIAGKPQAQPDYRQQFMEALEPLKNQYTPDQLEKVVYHGISYEFFLSIRERIRQWKDSLPRGEKDTAKAVKKEYWRKQFLGQKAIEVPEFSTESGSHCKRRLIIEL